MKKGSFTSCPMARVTCLLAQPWESMRMRKSCRHIVTTSTCIYLSLKFWRGSDVLWSSLFLVWRCRRVRLKLTLLKRKYLCTENKSIILENYVASLYSCFMNLSEISNATNRALLLQFIWKQAGLMVNTVDSGSSSPGSSPCWGHLMSVTWTLT